MSRHTKEQLTALLAPVGQEHLLRFWDALAPQEQDALGDQITSINWTEVLSWYRQVQDANDDAIPFGRLAPAPYLPLIPETPEQEELYRNARRKGEELLRQGKVAGFTVAGGQGTRLGYDGPKGTYRFSPLRNKALFQYFAEGILRNMEKYGCVLPWYVMTSPANHQATLDFFQENAFFGLAPENVRFFIQGQLPGFDQQGKALLEAPGKLALFANGHGGTLAALRDSGTLDDMEKRGVEYLSYWQVDNPMVTLFDPLFLGLHCLTGSQMSSRALIKRDPMEKLGHFCQLEGKTLIVEYSDMPGELLHQTDSQGRLTFRAGSPAIHVISREFIRRLTKGTLALAPHRALKKIPYVAPDGSLVTPDVPNGIKLEFFIFDALPFAHAPLILEADRQEQFAAIKNAQGSDSPDSCRRDLQERWARWLHLAGVEVPRKADGSLDATLELSPRRAICPQDVQELVAEGRIPRQWTPGTTFALD